MNITRPHVADKYGCKGSEEGRGRTSPWHVQVSVLGLLELQLYCLCLQLRVCDFLRLFVIVGTWWQLCYPNETLREHMARKVFTMFIVLILNLYQTTATEMSSPSRPGQS